MKVVVGKCEDVLKEYPDNHFHAVVTDPPYGLKFMGKKWDHGVPDVKTWEEILRVLKPGGFLLSFAGTRTHHRMCVNIEDAGFEIRDMIVWLYGSGFPKNLDVSKAIDKELGVEREVVGTKLGLPGYSLSDNSSNDRKAYGEFTNADVECQVTAPASPEAKTWNGFGTGIKPAMEPISLCRKPLTGTVAQNVLEYGTGALNIDGSRIPTDEVTGRPCYESKGWKNTSGQTGSVDDNWRKGRWPANVIHDGSEEVEAGMPETQPSARETKKKNSTRPQTLNCYGKYSSENRVIQGHGDNGSASRFFYCAKASRKERGKDNKHPTVKPLKLMRYLVKLVTPPGGIVLDPFAGSGTTGVACVKEGFDFVGIEMDEEHAETAKRRIKRRIEKEKGGFGVMKS
jgi:site-specific DNA-methyltransferase (adenine-specific)